MKCLVSLIRHCLPFHQMKADSDGLVIDEPGSVVGAKQMYSKILLELFAIDEPCGQRIIDTWKDNLSATHGLKKDRPYTSLEEYVPFRIQDVASRLVHSSTKLTTTVLMNIRVGLTSMLFGVGVAMTDEEFTEIEELAYPAYAALGLTNDCFSFDREYADREATSPGSEEQPMTNAVWLCMQWSDLDIAQAKEMVRKKALAYEDEYASKKSAFLSENPGSNKFRLCLDGLSQILIGTTVWSLSCPRYHPEQRYDANAGVENQFLGKETMPLAKDLRNACLEAKYRKDSGTHIDTLESTRHQQPASKHEHSAVEQPIGLSGKVVTAPFEYCANGSSKETRNLLIDALNVWIQAPVNSTKTIKSITTTLHTASLLLDDIEDQSPLRRGKPAAHTIFGVPSTINSANFAILEATEQASRLGTESLEVFFSSLRTLFIGQSYDLFWTKHNAAPSADEYLAMVDGKTGGLFQLFSSLLICNARQKVPTGHREELENLVVLIGRLYQIRDDFINLTSDEYASQKGSCEDLDEGKFSYPVLQALSCQDDGESMLRNLFAIRSKGGKISPEMKRLVLDEMRECGALDKTKQVIEDLRAETDGQVGKVEGLFGQENWVLRLLLHKLR
jgi:ophiobolin F synthase